MENTIFKLKSSIKPSYDPTEVGVRFGEVSVWDYHEQD